MPRPREDAGVVPAAQEDRVAAGHEPSVDNLQPRHLRDGTVLPDDVLRRELDPADDAVPVRLGVLRVQVRAPDDLLRHAAAVIDTDCQGVDARAELAKIVGLRGGNVVAGIHEMAVQV